MFTLRKLLLNIALPPLSIILLLVLAMLCYRLNYKYLGNSIAIFTLIFFYLISTPLIAQYLHASLASSSRRLTTEDYRQADLIVVLGGGVRESNQQVRNRQSSVTALPLERMRYAAHLYQQTGLPILVSGGSWSKNDAEADIMAQEFEQYFSITVTWRETESATTGENALYSRQLLDKTAEKLRKIILVTNDWHMKRAKYLFEQQGFTVLPAAVKRQTEQDIGIMSYVPQMAALMDSQIVIKEWIGYLAVRYDIMR
ncbi:hypothetical protein OA57_01475 [Chelonobacter oris]|uniref:DUF218 domain-containing protein n=1 Tax=Chelonobacter oris TaxID=505317 RepID=A0A0A3ANF9_9PAST|nr:YdcF family protein [Chelonobacter oris]KGQ70948.1 hypothetical protein OA57_01475 [Chelonobacter oris]